MEKKKSSVIYIIIIVILLVAVGGLVYVIKTSDNLMCDCPVDNCGKQVVEETKTYTYEDVSGEYKGSDEVRNQEKKVSGQDEAKGTLILYKNGTYHYDYSYYAAYGEIGNYIIDGNKIILNTIFGTSSDLSLHVYNKTKTLIINEDGSLIDTDSPVYDLTQKKELELLHIENKEEYEIDSFDHYRCYIYGYSEKELDSCLERIKSAK